MGEHQAILRRRGGEGQGLKGKEREQREEKEPGSSPLLAGKKENPSYHPGTAPSCYLSLVQEDSGS